jgi:hypothetical protein
MGREIRDTFLQELRDVRGSLIFLEADLLTVQLALLPGRSS